MQALAEFAAHFAEQLHLLRLELKLVGRAVEARLVLATDVDETAFLRVVDVFHVILAKQRDFVRPRIIFQCEQGKQVAVLGSPHGGFGHDSRQIQLAVLEIFQLVDRRDGKLGHLYFERVERMAGNVKAHHIFLEFQPFYFIPRLAYRWARRQQGIAAVHAAKQALLQHSFFGLRLVAVLDGFFQEVAAAIIIEILLAVQPETVERTGVGKALEGFLVDGAQVHALGQVKKVLVKTTGVAFLDQVAHGGLTRPFDGSQPEADLPGLVHVKHDRAFVHVGAQHGHAHAFAFFEEESDFLNVAQRGGQHGGHVFGRVVRFQIRRLVGHQGIASGVRLVERIRGKGFPIGPDFFQFLGGKPFGLRIFNELRLKLVQRLAVFLAHGLAQHVGIALGEIGQFLRQQHDLLLVNRYAVGFLQVFGHFGQVILDFLAAVLAVHVVGNVGNRAGAVQRVHGNQIAETVGLQVFHVLFHPVRFKLEHGIGFAALKQFVGFRIIKRHGINVNFHAVVALDQQQAVAQNRQVAQTQKVHLDHARILNDLALELRDEQVGFLRRGNGNDIRQIAGGDDDARRVDTGVAHGSLQFFGLTQYGGYQVFARVDVAHFLHILHLIGGDDSRQLMQGHMDELLEIHVVRRLVGNQLGQGVGVGQRIFHHPRHILDGRFGGHGAIRHDLRHLVAPVFLNHVINHFLPPFIVKVGVNIGHGLAVGIQKPLEKQLVFDRVNVGDADAIRHRRACRRAAPRPQHHTHVSASLDKVGHDEEIPRKTHCLDGMQFKIKAFHHFLRQRQIIAMLYRCVQRQAIVAAFGSFISQVAQVVVAIGEARRNREVGQQDVALEFQRLYLVHNLVGVVNGLRQVLEQFRHFGGALEIKLIVRKAEPVVASAKAIAFPYGLALQFAGVHAQQNVVGIGIVPIHVMRIVGGDDLDIVFGGKLEQHRIHFFLGGQLVPLQLHVIIPAKQIQPPFEQFFGAGLAVVQNRLRHFGTDAARGGNQAVVVFEQYLLVNARPLAVESFHVAQRTQFRQVFVAVLVLGQQQLVVAHILVFLGEFAPMAVFDHVKLAAHNRFDVVLVGFGHELERAEHIAVVGDGNGGHSVGLGFAHQSRYIGGPVKQ